MKYFIEIKDRKWVPGSNNKLIYTDKRGRLFLGPPIEFVQGDTIIIEASGTPFEDGYYHIINVIDKIPKKK